MKKVSWVISLSALLIFTGCLDTAEEVTINDNGSGLYVNSMDMGKLLGMAKSFAGDAKEMKALEKMKLDTLINLKDMTDSLKSLNAAEKKIIESGTLKVKIDIDAEVLSYAFSCPFLKTNDIGSIRDVLKKSKSEMVTNSMKNKFPDKGGEAKSLFGKEIDEDASGETGNEIDAYYTVSYEKNKITRKVIKEKIATIEEDKALKTLQEMSQMGMSMNMKTIINLPKPAKKAEGKGVKLSTDRKKVTIEGTLDDFFENASYFEYEIEY